MGAGGTTNSQGRDSNRAPDGASGLRAARPGPALAAQLTRLAGQDRRYGGCSDAEVTVAAGRWAAVEAHAAAMRLATVAEMIRRSPDTDVKPANAGDMPGCWEFGLGAQVGLELACSPGSGEAQLGLAWQLAARLPLTWQALRDGILDAPKARMIADETRILSDEDAGEAERQLSGYWAGKTWAQLQARITRIVCNLDPEAVARKREEAQRLDARVRFWRETTGAAGLAGYGLPPDEALQASARIQARARAYRRVGIPGTWDQLRAAAYLDLLNGSDARDRLGIATTPGSAGGTLNDADGDGDDGTDRAGGSDTTGAAGADASDSPDDGSPDDASPDDDGWPSGEDLPGDGDDGPGGNGGPDGNGGPGGNGGSGSGGPGGYGDGLAAHVDLTIPLVTLLGLGERAGEAAGLGAVDSALARDLAAAAFRNHASTFRLIITGPDGRAIGFGIARERKKKRHTGRGNPPPSAPAPPHGQAGPAGQPATPPHPSAQAGPPSRPAAVSGPLRGTVSASGTGNGSRTGSPSGTGNSMQDQSHPDAMTGETGSVCRFWLVPGPAVLPLDGLPGGTARTASGAVSWGTWRLAAAGREWDVQVIPLPAPGPCDHAFGTASYRPSETLRALIEIRDGGCAMPVCGRPARECEWEHGIPWPEGPTCSCNGGMHCTKDHRVKEAQGWTIEQRPDGRRDWTTPTGLTYTGHHKEYPD